MPNLSHGVRPGLFRRFNDPSAHPRFVLIGAENPDTVIVGRKIERERIVWPCRAEPGETVLTPLDIGAKLVGKRVADDAIDPVGADN